MAIRSEEEALAMVIVKSGANLSERYNNSDLKYIANIRKMERLVTLLEDIEESPESNLGTLKSSIEKANRNLLE